MTKIFNAAATAKRLTKAQRRAVMRGCISDETTRTIRILRDEHLFYLEPSPETVCFSLKLTEFGKTVQKCLVSKFGDRS